MLISSANKGVNLKWQITSRLYLLGGQIWKSENMKFQADVEQSMHLPHRDETAKCGNHLGKQLETV